MLRSFPIIILLLCLPLVTRGQGTLHGKVTDAKGEPLIGATVLVKSDPTKGTSVDFDGNYSLAIKGSTPVVVVTSFFGFQTKEQTVQLSNGESRTVNIQLEAENIQLQAFDMIGKARRSGDPYLEKLKINSASSVDYISRDLIAKTGDSDASAAVKRVTGVSTVGAFVTVRGLADRYIVTTINGSRIPTMDPFTNNLRLDLFPTGLLDAIVISKTATPDLPGDWSGALISLNTNDYPEHFVLNVGTTLGFNPNSSWQNIVSATSSSTDWLGHDDGLRAIPNGVSPDVEQFPLFLEPDLYQQLGLLGLGDFLNSHGIVGTTPGFQNSEMSTSGTLPHLALTELGLLAPALLYDENAVQAGVDAYNAMYNLAYFSPTVNGELADLNVRFNNANWRVSDTQGSPNLTQYVSIGNSFDILKKSKNPKTLGFLIGFRYASETQYDGGATMERTGEASSDTNPGDQFDRKGTQQISSVSNGWNAIGNLSLQLDRNNSVSLMVMPNVLGENHARYMVFLQPSISGETFVSEDQYYEQRDLWVYEYGSKHFIPALNLKVDLDASYSDGNRDVLDLKTLQYIQPPPGQTVANVDGALTPPARIYRFLDETLLDTRVGFTRPLKNDDSWTKTLKFGGGYRDNQRENSQSYFTVLGAPGPTQWMDPGRFEMRPDGRFTSQYAPFGTFKDNDIGISKVISAYVMSDFAVSPRWRLISGVRAEHTDLLTDIQRYHDQGLAPDDPARGTVGDIAVGGAAGADPKPAVPGMIDQWDVLPSINSIYKLRQDEDAPMNLRMSYFRSLARPSFREFSVVQLYDFILNAPVYGNPDLKMTGVDNFDLRIERFFNNHDNISVSAFYKHFTNHIELLSTLAGGFTWRNADRSEVIGAEVEGRLGLTKHLEWRGNVTLIHSRSDLTTIIAEQPVHYSTPMFGQAPYIINSMLNYAMDSIGFTVSVSYNIQGARLAVSNSEIDPTGIRAYEMPRHLIDITLNKTFGRHWGARLRLRNLLNAPQRRAYLFDQGYAVDFDSYAYGSEYALTVYYTIR
ncbi:MAG: TonB-dependent receptor [Flavobacteriales bacterium]